MSRKRSTRLLVRLTVVIILVAIIVGFRLVEQIGPERSPEDRFVVTRVIDGDTFELAGGDRVRLLAIDTPEKDEPYYNEAKSFLRDLVLGRAVRIEYADRRRDRYGRLLGYVYLDSTFVNKAILDNGLGYLYLFKDNELDRPTTIQLLRAQQKALADRSGIWSLEREREDRYINVAGSFRFHRPGCRSVRDVRPGNYQVFGTREEALAQGLSPCRNCKP